MKLILRPINRALQASFPTAVGCRSKLGVMMQEEAADWLLNHGFKEEACALNPDLAINPYSTFPPKVEPSLSLSQNPSVLSAWMWPLVVQ